MRKDQEEIGFSTIKIHQPKLGERQLLDGLCRRNITSSIHLRLRTRGTMRAQHLRCQGCGWPLVFLVCFLTCSSWAMYVDFVSSSSRCMTVPRHMPLCYGIGYTEMRIPNLLEHETMAEVIQQSSSWLPLLARECHPDARIFLCSLFAPICLEG